MAWLRLCPSWGRTGLLQLWGQVCRRKRPFCIVGPICGPLPTAQPPPRQQRARQPQPRIGTCLLVDLLPICFQVLLASAVRTGPAPGLPLKAQPAARQGSPCHLRGWSLSGPLTACSRPTGGWWGPAPWQGGRRGGLLPLSPWGGVCRRIQAPSHASPSPGEERGSQAS